MALLLLVAGAALVIVASALMWGTPGGLFVGGCVALAAGADLGGSR